MGTNDSRLDDILDAWQEAFERGADLPIKELCGDRPDLLNEATRQIDLLRRVLELRPPLDASGTIDHPAPPGDRVADDTATASAQPGTSTALPSVGPGQGLPTELPGYELLGELGQGGMGLVLKARQRATGRIVAVKLILAGELADAAARARFRAEVEATAQLSHPHIVQLYEAGEAAGRAFLSCEFVAGGSLAGALDGTPWEAKRAARLLAPLARAVAHAHAAGVIHRDLKPANILLTLEGQAKIADFGLAKRLDADSHTHTGAVMGTPSYMPPEQAHSAKAAGPSADVYSLGAVLYELLTGRPPFKGASLVETLDLVRTQEPVPPRVLQPRLPRDAETVCLKCLQKDPARRYVSAHALAEDLDRFLEGRPIHARPVRPAERAWRWCRRNPAVASLVTAILLLLSGVTGASIVAASYFDHLAREAEQTAGSEREARAQEARERAEAERLRGEAERQRRATERQIARQYVEAGNRLVDDGDVAGALLWNVAALEADPEQGDAIRPRLGMLLRQTPTPLHTFVHQVPVISCRIDPQGRNAVVVCEDRTVVVCDLVTGARLHTLQHDRAVSRVEFSRDGSRLATVCGDPTPPPGEAVSDVVRVWSVSDGKALSPPLTHCDWRSADAGRLAFFEEATRGPSNSANTLLSPSGERVLICPDRRTVTLNDANTGRELVTVYRAPDGREVGATLSPDGSHVLLCEFVNDADGSVPLAYRLTDLSDPKKVAKELSAPAVGGGAGRPGSATFSPDGRYVVVVGDDGLRVWDVTGRAVWERLAAPRPKGSGMPQGDGRRRGRMETRFSPDGRFLSAADREEQDPTRVRRPDFSTQPGSGGDSRRPPVVVDLHTMRLVELPPTAISVSEFGPQGQFVLAWAAGRLTTFSTVTGRESDLSPNMGADARLSPDGLHLLTSEGDTTVRVYARQGGRRSMTLPHEAPVADASFTPDASRVVTVTGSVLRVWPLTRHDTTERAIPLDLNSGSSAYITPDGTGIVTYRNNALGGRGPEVRVWDAVTGAPLTEPIRPEPTKNRTSEVWGNGREGTYDRAGEWLLLTEPPSGWWGQPRPQPAPLALHLRWS